jgi:hypothetical protein
MRLTPQPLTADEHEDEAVWHLRHAHRAEDRYTSDGRRQDMVDHLSFANAHALLAVALRLKAAAEETS